MFAIAIAASVLAGMAGAAQRRDAFVGSRDNPAIQYSTRSAATPISNLNQQLQRGAVQLNFEPSRGYLGSVLERLQVPVESQIAVFSQTSVQGTRVHTDNPRTIFFNDSVAVGWVRGGTVVEVAAHDPRQGVVFYTLAQTRTPNPRFVRDDTCLACHLSWDTLGVPGFQVVTTFPLRDPGGYANGFVTNHRTPLHDRWGGWYVTGRSVPPVHLGNVPVELTEPRDPNMRKTPGPLLSLHGRFDLTGYMSPYSDVVALMVLEHQAHMANLITRLGWEARLAGSIDARVRDAANDLVDYLLFVDEAPLPGEVRGTAGFEDQFSARGPHDRQGRTLRQLDLKRRLFVYPCSYMVYSEAFEALPKNAKDAVYRRMWEILSGNDEQASYAHLSPRDRHAIVEILSDTKKDLPPYFQPSSI